MLQKILSRLGVPLLSLVITFILTGCDFFGLRQATDINYQPIVPQRNNAIAMDGNSNAIAVWFADGVMYSRRYDSANGWSPLSAIVNDIDGEVQHLDVAMTSDYATAVWEQMPGSGLTRGSYALNFGNGSWDTMPLPVNTTTPGADPTVAANAISGQPYLAAIAWTELVNGRNASSGQNFQTLVPHYREQRQGASALSNVTMQGVLPAQNWIASNVDIAVDGQSNAITVWSRRHALVDGTQVDAVFAVRKPLDAAVEAERWIGYGNVIGKLRVVADQAGNANAFWIQDGQLFTNHFNGTSGVWRLSNLSEPVGNQTSVTDFAVATNPAGYTAIAWINNNDSVHVTVQAPDGIYLTPTVFGIANADAVGIGIADNNNMRVVVQGSGQLYSANYVESLATWSALSYVTDIGDGNLSFAMDGTETAIAIWDLDAGNDTGRQVWVPGAPTASFGVTPNPAETNQSITFDASSSTAQGSIASYEWDFDNDDTIDSTVGPIVTHSYINSGAVTARLRVVDDTGRFSEALQTVTVNDPGVENQFTLTVSTDMNGIVSSSPTGIDCGTDCSEMYDADTNVTLTATAMSGFAFDRWAGDCSGDPGFNGTTVVMNADKNCSASFFANASNSLAVSVTGAGTVTSPGGAINCGADCFENYSSPGTSVELFATPTNGWLFEQWSGGCFAFSSNPIHAFATVTGDISCDASFVVPTTAVTLTLNINADPGRVFEHYAGLDCNHPGGATATTCTATYSSGMDIVLRVESTSSADWFEGCDSLVMVDPANGIVNCALQINSDTTATVVFR